MGVSPAPSTGKFVPVTGSAQFASARRVGFLGDSITYGVGAAAGQNWTQQLTKIIGSANVSADSQVNAGVPGNTSGNMLARYGTAIRGSGVKFLYLLAGTNDIAQGVPLATFAANMQAIYQMTQQDGIKLIVGTIPPMGTAFVTSAFRLAIEQFNLWLTIWASANNIPLAQVWDSLASSGGTDYLSGYDSGDGIHPNTLGHQQIAQAYVAVSVGLFTTRYPIVYPAGYQNLCDDPLVSSGGTKPTGWFEQPGGTGAPGTTYTTLVDTTGRLRRGKWAQMAFNATTTGGTRYLVCPINAGWSVGDTLAIFAKFLVTDVAGNYLTYSGGSAPSANVSLRIFNQSFVLLSTLLGYATVVQPGDLIRAFTVPAGTTGMSLVLGVTLPAGCNITAAVGEVGVYDATSLGVTTLL